MNACFYVAIDRLPLGTVAAIEFLPVIALAAIGARSIRNAAALVLAVPGVYLLTGVQFEGEPLGVALAFANAVLFAAYIVLAHRVARHGGLSGIDGLAASMLVAAVVVTPLGGWEVLPALTDPVALIAGVGVGLCSSVIPYVSDQLAMRRLPRATYALMVAAAARDRDGDRHRGARPDPVLGGGGGRGARHHGRRDPPPNAGAAAAKRSSGTSRAAGPGQCSRISCGPALLSRPRSTSATTMASSSWPSTGMKSGTRSNGHRQVGERERRPQLPAAWYTRVLEQPLEEDRAVGNQLGDHADVPLAVADHERDDQSHVTRQSEPRR